MLSTSFGCVPHGNGVIKQNQWIGHYGAFIAYAEAQPVVWLLQTAVSEFHARLRRHNDAVVFRAIAIADGPMQLEGLPMRAVSKLVCILATTLSLSSLPATADVVTYSAALSPEASGASGSGEVLLSFDNLTNMLSIDATFAALSGTTTVAHIHCCTAVPFSGVVGVAVTPGTLPGFPVGVIAGLYSVVIDLDLLTSFTGGFLAGPGGGTAAGARTALLAGLDNGTAYFNVHTTTFPGGEIRGFPQRVPEPGTLLLAGLAMAALWLAPRTRRSASGQLVREAVGATP